MGALYYSLLCCSVHGAEIYTMRLYNIWWHPFLSELGAPQYFLEWNGHATSTFLGTVGMAPPPEMRWAFNLHPLVPWVPGAYELELLDYSISIQFTTGGGIFIPPGGFFVRPSSAWEGGWADPVGRLVTPPLIIIPSGVPLQNKNMI